MKPEWEFLSRKVLSNVAPLHIFFVSSVASLLRPAAFAPAEQGSALRLRFPALPFRHYLVAKRWLDIAITASLLLALVPLLVVIAFLIKLDSPGPVIFAQDRVGSRVRGKGGKRSWHAYPFTVYKFRTMYHNADSKRHQAFVKALIEKDYDTLASLQGKDAKDCQKFKMVNDPRVTPIGRFLRKTSLDELPQLWNVLRGDMSLVGPRPAIAYEVDMYAPDHVQRLAAKPGLTGVWQITSRSSVDFDQMVKLDVWYVENQSLWLDMKILAKTPVAVLHGKGAV